MTRILDWGTRPPVVFFAGVVLASVGIAWLVAPAAGLIAFGATVAWDAARPTGARPV